MNFERLLGLSYFQQSRILLTAVELDLFPRLNQPSSAIEVAKEKALNPDATERLLNALVALEILRLDKDLYVVVDELKEALADGPMSVIPMLKHRARMWIAWSALSEIVRTGKTYYELHEPDFDHWENLPNFIRAMAVSGRKIATETVAALDLKDVGSVLDIGGGPGIYAAEFLKVIPDARVCILDLPGVRDVAVEFLECTPHSGRICFIDGNVLEIEDSIVIGEDSSGKFNLVFMSNLIHSMSPDEVKELFKRCVTWCAPGGRVVVKDFLLDDTRTSPAWAALFDINMLTGTPSGRSYTWTEVEKRLMAIENEKGDPIVTETSRIHLSDGYSGMVVAEIA